MARGQVIEKGPGKWLVRVYGGVVDGKKVYPSKAVKGTRADAEKALTELLHKGDTQPLVEPRATTVNQLCDRWFAWRVFKRPKTALEYRKRIDSDIRPALGPLAVQSLTGLTISNHYASLLSERGYSNRTVQYTHAIFRQVLEFARHPDVGLLSVNPCDSELVKLAPAPARPDGALSPQQVATLIRVTEGDSLGPLWRLMLTSGLGPAEALALHWEDLTDTSVRVRRVLEAGANGGMQVSFEAKRKARLRTVSLSPETVAALRKLPQHPGFIFQTSTGGHLDPSNVRKAWKAALEKARIPTHHRLYDTRRTHLSILLSKGVPIATVARRAGHADQTVLLRFYSQHVPGMEDPGGDVAEKALKEAFQR